MLTKNLGARDAKNLLGFCNSLDLKRIKKIIPNRNFIHCNRTNCLKDGVVRKYVHFEYCPTDGHVPKTAHKDRYLMFS
jgi:hypothetical protein